MANFPLLILAILMHIALSAIPAHAIPLSSVDQAVMLDITAYELPQSILHSHQRMDDIVWYETNLLLKITELLATCQAGGRQTILQMRVLGHTLTVNNMEQRISSGTHVQVLGTDRIAHNFLPQFCSKIRIGLVVRIICI